MCIGLEPDSLINQNIIECVSVSVLDCYIVSASLLDCYCVIINVLVC